MTRPSFVRPPTRNASEKGLHADHVVDRKGEPAPHLREELAEAQGLPGKFLEGILNQLRRSGLVISRRGAEGGYRLARPADQITFAEVVRAIVPRWPPSQ